MATWFCLLKQDQLMGHQHFRVICNCLRTGSLLVPSLATSPGSVLQGLIAHAPSLVSVQIYSWSRSIRLQSAQIQEGPDAVLVFQECSSADSGREPKHTFSVYSSQNQIEVLTVVGQMGHCPPKGTHAQPESRQKHASQFVYFLVGESIPGDFRGFLQQSHFVTSRS